MSSPDLQVHEQQQQQQQQHKQLEQQHEQLEQQQLLEQQLEVEQQQQQLEQEQQLQQQNPTSAEQNAENAQKLENQVGELLVSSYDPVVGKTIWQCAQCHFSSKFRFTVKRHIETHISGFTHQCPQCEKTSKTRNALWAHIMRAHQTKPNQILHQPGGGGGNQQNWNQPMSPDGMMQMQFQEMDPPPMKQARRPRQKRPWDEELEREIRQLLVSRYDPVEVKTTWHCAQCNYTNKLQYHVKQHIETHITSIVHQCVECPKILKTRNALRVHMIQKHDPVPKRVQSPPWMGGGPMSPQSSSGYPSPAQSPNQMQVQYQQQPAQRRRRADNKREQTPAEIELDRQVNELTVSNYDPVESKTTWVCAQCNFSSRIRSTVREHIETHLSGFSHECPQCQKTCKTRNALRVHIVQAHKNKNKMAQQQQLQQPQPQPQPQQQQPQPQQQQQQSSQGFHSPAPSPSLHQQQQHNGQQNMHVQEVKEAEDHKPPIPMYNPAPQRHSIMQPMMSRPPMYGHPMTMGHPMMGHPQI